MRHTERDDVVALKADQNKVISVLKKITYRKKLFLLKYQKFF